MVRAGRNTKSYFRSSSFDDQTGHRRRKCFKESKTRLQSSKRKGYSDTKLPRLHDKIEGNFTTFSPENSEHIKALFVLFFWFFVFLRGEKTLKTSL